jgi:hypothetical protein
MILPLVLFHNMLPIFWIEPSTEHGVKNTRPRRQLPVLLIHLTHYHFSTDQSYHSIANIFMHTLDLASQLGCNRESVSYVAATVGFAHVLGCSANDVLVQLLLRCVVGRKYSTQFLFLSVIADVSVVPAVLVVRSEIHI